MNMIMNEMTINMNPIPSYPELYHELYQTYSKLYQTYSKLYQICPKLYDT